MKNTISIIICLLFLTFSYSQSNKITGEWKLVQFSQGEDSKEENTNFFFKEDGEILVRESNFGTWKVEKKQLELTSLFTEEEFNGVHKITALTKTEFVFSNDKYTYHFKKVDLEKIRKVNESINIKGTWKVDNLEFENLFFTFDLPNTFTSLFLDEYTQEENKGEWIYLPETNEINIHIDGYNTVFKGKSRIKENSETTLALINRGRTLFLTKQKSEKKSKIERLTFKEEGFNEEQMDESLLPNLWRNNEKQVEFLCTIKQLEYDYETYINSEKIVKHARIIKKINVQKEDGLISISNFKVTAKDSLQYSESVKGYLMNEYNIFFPEEDLGFFRIIDIQEINVPAGIFTCTVIEGLYGETKVKYWMINDQPGVYAKIISEGKNVFDELDYFILTLNKITK